MCVHIRWEGTAPGCARISFQKICELTRKAAMQSLRRTGLHTFPMKDAGRMLEMHDRKRYLNPTLAHTKHHIKQSYDCAFCFWRKFSPRKRQTNVRYVFEHCGNHFQQQALHIIRRCIYILNSSAQGLGFNLLSISFNVDSFSNSTNYLAVAAYGRVNSVARNELRYCWNIFSRNSPNCRINTPWKLCYHKMPSCPRVRALL